MSFKTNAKKHAHGHKATTQPAGPQLMMLKASSPAEKAQLLYASFYAIMNEIYTSDQTAVNKFFAPKMEKRSRPVQMHRFASPIANNSTFNK